MAWFSERAEYSLDDFKRQLEKFASPGIIQKLIWLMPGMEGIRPMMGNPDTNSDSRRLVGIINAMTPAERRTPKMIEPSRRHRIAKGAGVRPRDVHQLVKQYLMMKPLLIGMAGKSIAERMKMIEEIRREDMPPPPTSLL